jgi:hypothetical protein
MAARRKRAARGDGEGADRRVTPFRWVKSRQEFIAAPLREA